MAGSEGLKPPGLGPPVAVVLTDLDASGIATLTIDRPEALNALNGEVLDAVTAAARELKGKAKALIVTGSGKAFVAGADIAQMQGLGKAEAEAFARRGHAFGQALAEFPGPVIAAINGYALG